MFLSCFSQTWMVKETEVFPLEKSDLESADDLANLKNLHEASLLHNVKKRYKTESAIYTYTGPGVLIALNPYQQLDLYTPEKFQQYRNRAIGELPPHLFAVADTTYRELCKSQKSQSVIISGESGSGKTESTKLILRYLANVSEKPQNQDPNQVSVEVQIVESGPLLEAFGNAKTVRNNNSSRFVRFLSVPSSMLPLSEKNSASRCFLGSVLFLFLFQYPRVSSSKFNTIAKTKSLVPTLCIVSP